MSYVHWWAFESGADSCYIGQMRCEPSLRVPFSRRAPLSSLGCFCALPVLLGCEEPTRLAPTPGDRVAGASVSGAVVRAQYLLDEGWRVSPVLDAPLGATRVGILAVGEPSSVQMEARGIDAAGQPGAWRPLQTTWRENDQWVARAELGLDAYSAQLRVRGAEALTHLLWSAMVPETPTAIPSVTEDDRGVASISQPLRPELTGLVRPREDWGARATRCSGGDPTKTRMAVHHTVTMAMGDPAARVRGIQNFHMDTRGWCDIGYHFLLTIDGTIWEARPLEYMGAHVFAHNAGNIGVSFVGCFDSGHPDCAPLQPNIPPAAMIDAGSQLITRLGGLYDIPLTPDRVMGHRDHDGASTVCPGDDLHAMLDELRSGGEGARYSAMYVDQSFPLASQEFVLAPGETREGYIEMRNTGTETWRPDEVFLTTTEPRLGDSPLAHESWVADSRPATVDREVGPGETGRFSFTLQAPNMEGDYPQYFNLFRWGVAWFSDPDQGGPPDDQLQVRVQVRGMAMSDAGVDASMMDASMEMDAGSLFDGGIFMDAGADAGPRGDSGGCGCHVAGAQGKSAFPWWLALGALWMWSRRRVAKAP